MKRSLCSTPRGLDLVEKHPRYIIAQLFAVLTENRPPRMSKDSLCWVDGEQIISKTRSCMRCPLHCSLDRRPQANHQKVFLHRGVARFVVANDCVTYEFFIKDGGRERERVTQLEMELVAKETKQMEQQKTDSVLLSIDS
ncbi:hypothetical protein CDAR_603221 [Caerostris darwini]|uniref:Uncharacterized protein n=1 Tax=Caerostris darwini TaxID=1538125 RepID=A0AAV4PM92_9ARAC|nr:hypothetical protein CDAR_603221 [Caerostris darwini]